MKMKYLLFMVLSLLLTACGNNTSQNKLKTADPEPVMVEGSLSDKENESILNDASPEQLNGMDYPTVNEKQTISLWNSENVPAWKGPQNNSETADYIPYMDFYPAYGGEQGKIKGAVLICPGGAFSMRSMKPEGYDIAEQLSVLGYQSFVVSYRLRPYSQEESVLDLTRAVRYVKYYADEYGIDENDIGVVGFSAGGILCGELLLHDDGTKLPSELDESYIPDEMDFISAEASAIGHIYSFYGRLAVSDNDVETLKQGDLPPTFYAYGTRDPFYRQFMQNANAVREAGVEVDEHCFEGMPHGFGKGNENADWIPLFDSYLMNIFENN